VGSGGSKFCGALSLYNIGGPLCGKEYKIRHACEYLFRAPPGAMEGVPKCKLH